jgi:hypothetical protein
LSARPYHALRHREFRRVWADHPTSRRTTTRRRSGSWRAAWRSCARSRSPT